MTWKRAGDLGLWAALGLLVLGESGARGDAYWLRAGYLTILAVAVLLRRAYPLVALALVGGTEIVILAISLGTTDGVSIALVPAIALLSYLAGRRESQLRYFLMTVSWGLVGLLVLGLSLRRDVAMTSTVLSWLLMLLLALLVVVLPWLVGRYRAQQALLASAGWDRAERIEREHQLEIDRERLRERSRIAEDMHDSVGHELSLIALRAAALEIDAELPERHRRAAGELREAAAAATERLGEIIGVLRDADAEAPLVPARDSVADLVDRAAASGLAVRLVQHGTGELSPMVDRAVHRIVQESLTNASKHAPGAAVTVTITHEPSTEDVVVRVVDGGAERAVGEVVSGGRGLAGLKERVRLVGGVLTAGPRVNGGFEVVARMPRKGGKPEPEQSTPAAAERDTVRRRARRGLITAIAAPLAVGALVGVVALGYYLIAGYSSILKPEQYDRIELGQSLDEVEKVLPAMQMVDPPTGRLPEPAEWSCRYYPPDAPFAITYAYRLCFQNDRLVAKDVVQTGSRPPTPEGTATSQGQG
ncbi:sensor histidine kinase [Kribbella monticola]|uniref:sensor histidine kinase n=1 Tax=Kribbella monticola TaxID=2185285 RepID=UPI000DD4D719|nr:histidine kinase [Kribbella monticola]